MKRSSIVREVQLKLLEMEAYHKSKHRDKQLNDGKPKEDRIYSFSTMDNYFDVCMAFARYARGKGCRTLDQARDLTGTYLQERMDRGLSAWTIRRDAAAIAKLYRCKTTELGVKLPTRRRANIKQHRTNASKGKFSERKHRDLVEFCRATGLRRSELLKLVPSDVFRGADGHIYVEVKKGKGGKHRTVTALTDQPYEVAQAAIKEGKEHIFDHIPKYAPIHEYRREFAQAVYHANAREVKSLDRKDIYCCRRDKQGVWYDKKAMMLASEQLGHGRLDVIAMHYL